MSLDQKSKKELIEIIEQGESGKLFAELEAAKATIATLEEEKASASEGAASSAEVKSLKQQVADLELMVVEQATTIKANDATRGDAVPLVNRDSGTYQVVAGANGMTRMQLATNDKAFDELLAKGYPGIKKIA